METTARTETMIRGVTLTSLRQIGDQRGAVLHMLRCDSPEHSNFGECYFSEVRPDAVKAWKRHRVQSQNIAVPTGRIRLVIFDDREGSATHGQFQVLVLGRPDAYVRVHIPPSLWYGFGCIGETSALLANCTDVPHEASECETRRSDDARIPYRWKNEIPRDQTQGPTLIRVSKSCLSEVEKDAVMGVLDRERLGMGTDVQQFEAALSDFFGRPSLCVVNGTAALHVALEGCGIGWGDEVLVPSLTFVA